MLACCLLAHDDDVKGDPLKSIKVLGIIALLVYLNISG